MVAKGTVLVLALLLFFTTNSFIVIGTTSASTETNFEDVLDFLEEVVMLDLTKYDDVTFGYTVQDYSIFYGEDGKYVLSSGGSSLSVLFAFRNHVLSWVSVNPRGSFFYLEQPSDDVDEIVNGFLERYQQYSGDSDVSKIRAGLSASGNIHNTSTIIDNLKFSVSNDNVSVSLSWHYHYCDLTYPVGVTVEYDNGVFRGFSDDRMFEFVGDPSVNISEEEARIIALEQAELVALDASKQEWTSFEIPEKSITAELVVRQRETNVYFPRWIVSLSQNNPFLGYTGKLTVSIWANDGYFVVETPEPLVRETSYSGVLSTDNCSWTSLTPMPTARSGLGVAVVDGKIYAIGGYNGSFLAVNEVYDPITNSWTTKSSMPTARKDFAIAVYQNKIYVFGGNGKSSRFLALTEVYDPTTDVWETKSSMPTPRSDLDANVVNNKFYLIGGMYTTEYSAIGYCETKINEVYDPTTDTWATKASMNTSVWGYMSGVVGSKIYVISGKQLVLIHHVSYTLPKVNQIYDTENDTWSAATPIPLNDLYYGSGATAGILFPTGIMVLSDSIPQLYEVETDSWFIGEPMPTTRTNFAVAVINDEVYAIGGQHQGYLGVNEKFTAVGYVPEFPSWIILPLLFVATLTAILFRKRLRGVSSRF